jgi:hypothetical protein
LEHLAITKQGLEVQVKERQMLLCQIKTLAKMGVSVVLAES